MKIKLSKELRILILSFLVALILIGIGIFSRDIGVLGNMAILAVFIIAAPQLFLRYARYRELKEMEEKFPLFLRDLAESIRSGMPFHKSIMVASKLEYGGLTKEIKKMTYQLSWGMTLDKVLDKFVERVKDSKRLYRATKIIKESYISGGEVVSTLQSVSDSLTMLADSEKERMSILNQYVILMYAIAFIFIAIVSAINKLMIPIFKTGEGQAVLGQVVGLTNPCDRCMQIACNICSVFEGTSQYLFFIPPKTIAAYYMSLFFWMALVQSAFSGLIAGQISENSLIAGIKHTLILVVITFGAFSILIRLGIMGV